MLVAGAGFGALPGTLLCLTACTVGASLSMLAARHFLQALVRRKLGERLARLDRRIATDGAAYLFSLRLLPVIPFAVVNVAAGLSTMKAWTFTWVSFVGMLAGTFVYVNAGTQLAYIQTASDIYTPRVLLSLAALAVVPWLAQTDSWSLAAPGRRSRMTAAGTLVLFNYDWDQSGFARWRDEFPIDSAGFDLFSFPSNARLVNFDLQRFVDRLARQARRRGWQAVTSNQEQFGALAAALLAERMGWPGTPVAAVLACQHKYHARRVLEDVAPEANTGFELLASHYGEPVPDDIDYPVFVKPVKAAFSVLARTVRNRDELAALVRFGAWELWVIRHLVEPFERIARARLPAAGSAHRMLLERPVTALQYNLDGYVFQRRVARAGRRRIGDVSRHAGLHALWLSLRPAGRRAGTGAGCGATIPCRRSASRMACSTWSSFTMPRTIA